MVTWTVEPRSSLARGRGGGRAKRAVLIAEEARRREGPLSITRKTTRVLCSADGASSHPLCLRVVKDRRRSRPSRTARRRRPPGNPSPSRLAQRPPDDAPPLPLAGDPPHTYTHARSRVRPPFTSLFSCRLARDSDRFSVSPRAAPIHKPPAECYEANSPSSKFISLS